MRNLVLAFIMLFSVNFTFAQFGAATVSAYYTNDSEIIEFGSVSEVRRVEVKIESLDSLALHGCMVEVLEADSDYILSRKIGNKYEAGTMNFVSYENGDYILDMGYFQEDLELKVLVRMEDYQKKLSDLTTITLAPYEE